MKKAEHLILDERHSILKDTSARYNGFGNTIALHLMMTVIRLLTVCPRQEPSGQLPLSASFPFPVPHQCLTPPKRYF